MHSTSSPIIVTRDIRLSEVLAALSHALDLTEGQPLGHTRADLPDRDAARATRSGSTTPDRRRCTTPLLLKDAGCSSNARE